MTSTGIQESDETYLLTVAGGSAKVRDDLMDDSFFARRTPTASSAGSPS